MDPGRYFENSGWSKKIKFVTDHAIAADAVKILRLDPLYLHDNKLFG